MCRSILTVLCLLISVHLAMSACPKLVSRSQWGASSQGYRTPMRLPVPFVLIHHTYQPGFCNTSSSCMKSMRGMQNYHKNDRKWDDIGYHFCIGGTGQVYQGRGWDIEGVHSPNYNHRSVGISFIGDFTNKLPTAKMLQLAKSLINCGVKRNSIAANYTLLGHRQVRITDCPGNALFKEIKTWPHWKNIKTTRI
ncbi:peptidoglycan-recognition protein SB1-like [Periplaneta americana]|uniref:peptidoglycan-recognition protein SB1-like n=1 Tax=Periplaneta americana TaxID=6978 RepID=UPI0037E80328